MASEQYHQSQLDLIDTERFFSLIRDALDERSRRLVVAAIAESGGRENLSHVARCANVSRPVVYSGLSDLYDDAPGVKANGERRQRKAGGGRNTALENAPEIAEERGLPVISVDTKKKELVGNFRNAGRDYRPKGIPVLVEEHDFATEDGRATPYGVFDIANNEAFVNVGLGPDTAEFAVESIEKWWDRMGTNAYPTADGILITADGGGSNGSRCRLWKLKLQEFATRRHVKVAVSHYPPGTSKWNKIEHMVFSFITQNWRGTPLTSVEVIVNLIANTTNSKGLKVVAEMSKSNYAKGVKVSDEQMEAIKIKGDAFHPEWNYTISP